MLLALRLLLAAVFAFAAAAKIMRPLDTRRTMRALRLPAVAVLAGVLPLVELATAVALVVIPQVGASAALALLVMFTVLMVNDIREGRSTPCGCFGPRSTKPIAWDDVARNGLLAAAAIAVLVG